MSSSKTIQSSMKDFFRAYGLALAWAIVILKLSTMSLVPLSKFSWSQFGGLDKIAHFGFYFILTFLLFHGLFQDLKPNRINGSLILKGIMPPIIYGFLIELLQSTCFEGRYFELLDFVANTLGCFAALWIVKYLNSKKLWFTYGQEKQF